MRSSEFVEKIFYCNNNYITFTPYNYNLPDATFRDRSGNMLSDHDPLSVNFNCTLNTNFKFSNQFGGPHGTSYNDVNSLPAKPVVQVIEMRSGNRVDQVNLTLSNGITFVHSGTGGTANQLPLGSGEYITSVTMDSGQYNGDTRVFYASFTTTLGRTMSGGSTTGTKVTYTAPAGRQIVGFHGRTGEELDKASVIYAPVN